MVDKKISELTAIDPLDGTESFAVVQGGTTKKATADEIATRASDALGLGTAATTDADEYAKVEFYTTTILTTDWTGTGPFIATKTVSGLLSADAPIVDLDVSGVTFSDVPDVVGEFGLVYRVEASNDDELKVYATSEPTEDFDLTIQVVR